MATSMIRWSKDDRQNLQKAVNNYNAKIRRLKKKGMSGLPELVSYEAFVGYGRRTPEDSKFLKELSEEENNQEIFTRRQLNRTIKSLKAFTKKGSERQVTLSSGEIMTTWEYMNIKSQRKQAKRLLNRNLEAQRWAKQFGMGTGEAEVTEKTIKSIDELEEKTGRELKRLKDRLMKLSRSDREMKKAQIWRDNFEKALDELDNYDNIDLLKEKMKTIKNPIKLFEYLKDNEELMDLFLYYKEKPSNRTYGGYDNNQEAIDNALQRLGLIE